MRDMHCLLWCCSESFVNGYLFLVLTFEICLCSSLPLMMAYSMKKEKNLRKNENILRVADDSSEYGMEQILPPVLVLTQTLVLILTQFEQRTFILSTTVELVTRTFWPQTRKPMGIMRFWFLGSTIERLPEGTMYVSNLSSSSHARNTGGKLKSAKQKRWIFCIWAFYSGMVRIKRILLVAVVKWNKKEGRHAFWSHYA